MLTRTSFSFIVVITSFASACSSSSPPCPSGMCAGEAGADTASDASADAQSDTANDIATDAPADTATDSPPPTDTGADVSMDASSDAACGACLTDDVSWGYSGGFVAYHDTYGATPCNTFSHMHTLAGGSTTMCTDSIPCNGTISTTDLENAIANPDVQNALAMAPITFGRIFPDAPSYLITVNGHTITILQPCSGAASCTDPPAGVQALRTLLDMLAAQQDAMPACTAVFGSG